MTGDVEPLTGMPRLSGIAVEVTGAGPAVQPAKGASVPCRNGADDTLTLPENG